MHTYECSLFNWNRGKNIVCCMGGKSISPRVDLLLSLRSCSKNYPKWKSLTFLPCSIIYCFITSLSKKFDFWCLYSEAKVVDFSPRVDETLRLKAATFAQPYRHCQAEFSKERLWKIVYVTRREATTSNECDICPRFARVANFALFRNRCCSPLVT